MSFGFNLKVSCDNVGIPGVSIIRISNDFKDISIELNVVPGTEEVVRFVKGFLYFSIGIFQHFSDNLLINDDFPEFVAPITYTFELGNASFNDFNNFITLSKPSPVLEETAHTCISSNMPRVSAAPHSNILFSLYPKGKASILLRISTRWHFFSCAKL